jgi:hypothetical protein
MVSGNFTQNNLDLLPLQITQPDLMEVWKPGTTHQISWNADPLFEHIRLELYRKEEFKFIISSNEPNRCEFKWTVPDNLALSHHYRIKIVSEDYPSRYEYSDFFFVLNQ